MAFVPQRARGRIGKESPDSYTSRMAGVLSKSKSRLAWPVALSGLGLFVFAVVGLSGPGRIDIVDGQTRFEVGRSLVEHGDSVLRDERIWWSRFPGRNCNDYSYYRFPQSFLAAGAIWLADATGPVTEGRRHFFYVQCGAVGCGLLSILYAIWFRRIGCRPLPALLWGAGGVFCTPMWFYGTSTFDEYLGTTALIATLLFASLTRGNPWGAIFTGLLLGLTYNCKQPLASFAILAVVLNDDRSLSRGQRLLNAAYIAGGLIAGIVAEMGYDRFKFPFDKDAVHAEQHALYGPNFANHQLAAATVLSVSFGAGVIWYFPPLAICVIGLVAQWRVDRRIVIALVVSSIPFLGFFLSLSYFKGDPSWGPRYLTPLLGVLWLFAPLGAARLRRPLVGLLLGLGVMVQVLALSVDPHRLYVQRDASSGFGRVHPMLYFNPALAHLMNRPREIVEIARETEPAEAYSPSPSPTFAFPVLDPPYLEKRGPEVVRKYRVLNGFRPWWSNMTWLPPDERPVPLGRTAALLLAISGAGLVLLGAVTSRFEGSP